jgi:hypothetical protein
MTAVKRRAVAILHALEEADAQLVGTAVVLTDGTAGTVEAIWLDDLHGLLISIAVTREDGLSQPSNSRKAECSVQRGRTPFRNSLTAACLRCS